MEALGRLPPVVTHADAARRGITDRALRKLLAENAVELLRRGIYRRLDIDVGGLDYAEVILRAPMATLCLTTALSQHNLIDMIPYTIDVALPQETWSPRVSAPVTWHKFARASFDIGREISTVDSQRIGVYDAPRSIIDTFRLRHIETHELALEALKTWIRRRGSDIPGLLAMARRIDPRSEVAIGRTLEILL